MSFVATAFWRLHLGIDIGVCSTTLFMGWVSARKAQDRRTVLSRFLIGAVLGLIPWLIASLIVAAFIGKIFGFCLFARALWTAVTVAAPVAAIGAALRTRRIVWLFPAALLIAFKWWGEIGEPSRLEIERVAIPMKGIRTPLKIAHFSDLQTDGLRETERWARSAANEFDPDYVTFTGDVLNDSSLTPVVFEYLSGFHAHYRKLYVTGDVDGGLNLERFSSSTGFEVMDGKTRVDTVGMTTVSFVGFGLLDYLRGGSYAETLLSHVPVEGVRLILSHRPDEAFALKGLPVSALFTGHTHGGQLQLPGFGPLVTLTRVPRQVAAGGVHEFNGFPVILARGLGWEGHIAPRVRLFCRPHLMLVTLVAPKS